MGVPAPVPPGWAALGRGVLRCRSRRRSHGWIGTGRLALPRPGTGHHAAYHQGALVAIGALHTLGSGVPHLAGIVTHSALRGRGLGAAMVTELTNRAIAVAGVSTLGVHHHNEAAIRLYRRLGYRTAHVFRTADLTR